MSALTALMAMALLISFFPIERVENDELQMWLQNERANHKIQVPPQTPTVHIEHHERIYMHRRGVEPFSAQRLLRTTPADVSPPVEASQQTAIRSQTRASLDGLPLAGMRLVGSLQRGGETLAMLRVQGLIYSIRVGDKIGQDQGRVSAITMSKLVLREVALNAVGEQSERVISLALVQEP